MNFLERWCLSMKAKNLKAKSSSTKPKPRSIQDQNSFEDNEEYDEQVVRNDNGMHRVKLQDPPFPKWFLDSNPKRIKLKSLRRRNPNTDTETEEFSVMADTQSSKAQVVKAPKNQAIKLVQKPLKQNFPDNNIKLQQQRKDSVNSKSTYSQNDMDSRARPLHNRLQGNSQPLKAIQIQDLNFGVLISQQDQAKLQRTTLQSNELTQTSFMAKSRSLQTLNKKRVRYATDELPNLEKIEVIQE